TEPVAIDEGAGYARRRSVDREDGGVEAELRESDVTWPVGPRQTELQNGRQVEEPEHAHVPDDREMFEPAALRNAAQVGECSALARFQRPHAPRTEQRLDRGLPARDPLEAGEPARRLGN